MSKQPSGNASEPQSPPQRNAALLVLGDIADTAWRMFIPTIGLTILGLWIDKQLQTTPWIMIVLMVVGTALAALLVRRQLQRVNSEN